MTEALVPVAETPAVDGAAEAASGVTRPGSAGIVLPAEVARDRKVAPLPVAAADPAADPAAEGGLAARP